MTRERLTNKRTAGDATFGQSANDYWRKKALQAIEGAFSSGDKALVDQTQQVANDEARQLGVQAPQYAPAAPAITAPVGEENKMASEKVFEPQKTASTKTAAAAPVNPEAIGAQRMREMALHFPQYLKPELQSNEMDPKKMTLLSIPATRYNRPAVTSIVNTLDHVAGIIEKTDPESALQLDIVSELLTASIEEAELQEKNIVAAGDVEAAKKECEKCGKEDCECK